MNITKITNYKTDYVDITEKSRTDEAKKPIQEIVRNPDKVEISDMWQKNILMSTLDKLENSIQLDDNHPLDRMGSEPIETFDEAVLELNYFKQTFGSENFLDAQANLQPQDVLSLFISE